MIEEIVIQYLNKVLDIPVYAEMPKEECKCFVLVEKTGGVEENHIYSAVLTLQSYAESMHAAAELNEMVKKKMNEIISFEDISKCKLNTDYNYTDTTKKKYRYQAVYKLVY